MPNFRQPDKLQSPNVQFGHWALVLGYCLGFGGWDLGFGAAEPYMGMFANIFASIENILANPLRSFLTMLGVIIGVFSVILLVSIGEGAREYVTGQFGNLGTNLMVIMPGGSQKNSGAPINMDSTNKLTARDCDEIRKRCPSIKDAAPLILATTTAKFEGKQRNNTTIVGTTSNFQYIRHMYAEFGRFLPEGEGGIERKVCVLGRAVVRDMFGEGYNPLGKSLKLGGSNFRIVGIMAKKGVSLGFDLDDLVFVPIKAAEELFDTDELFEIIAQAKSADHVAPALRQVKDLLIKRHDGYEDFTVTSQSQLIETFGKILNVLTYALGGIAAISLLVGGIGIMNIMLVSVKDKTKEIGLRKAVGATRGDILWQFLSESVVLSSLGGIGGILFGVACGLLIHAFVPSLPVLFKPWAIVVAFVFAAAVGIFFGVYPARKAASLDPIEALRYE